jgi:hypothetical protein
MASVGGEAMRMMNDVTDGAHSRRERFATVTTVEESLSIRAAAKKSSVRGNCCTSDNLPKEIVVINQTEEIKPRELESNISNSNDVAAARRLNQIKRRLFLKLASSSSNETNNTTSSSDDGDATDTKASSSLKTSSTHTESTEVEVSSFLLGGGKDENPMKPQRRISGFKEALSFPIESLDDEVDSDDDAVEGSEWGIFVPIE